MSEEQILKNHDSIHFICLKIMRKPKRKHDKYIGKMSVTGRHVYFLLII